MSNGITTLVCNDILPSSLKAGCDDFLGIYLNAAIELTVTEWSPTEICADIHACQSSTGKCVFCTAHAQSRISNALIEAPIMPEVGFLMSN